MIFEQLPMEVFSTFFLLTFPTNYMPNHITYPSASRVCEREIRPGMVIYRIQISRNPHCFGCATKAEMQEVTIECPPPSKVEPVVKEVKK